MTKALATISASASAAMLVRTGKMGSSENSKFVLRCHKRVKRMSLVVGMGCKRWLRLILDRV